MNEADKKEKLIQLLTSLIDISSPTGKEGRLGEYLEDVLKRMGFRVTRQHLSQDRFNLLARKDSRCRVLFCTHLDTVSPQLPSSLSGGVIRGRGACDAKGALAAMVLAAKQLLEEGAAEPGLLFVVGEEKDSDGARRAAELEVESEYLILGEPTNNRVAAGQKGSLVFRIEVVGQSAHSACPEKGKSAIHTLVELLGDWTSLDWGDDPEFGPNLLNIGKIQGGVGANVVSAEASAEGIFRIGTTLSEIEQRVLNSRREDVSIRILSSSNPVRLHVPAGFETSVVSFGSDAPYLEPLGKVVMIGPGSIEFAHSPDEQIAVNQLLAAQELYVKLAKQLAAG